MRVVANTPVLERTQRTRTWAHAARQDLELI